MTLRFCRILHLTVGCCSSPLQSYEHLASTPEMTLGEEQQTVADQKWWKPHPDHSALLYNLWPRGCPHSISAQD